VNVVDPNPYAVFDTQNNGAVLSKRNDRGSFTPMAVVHNAHGFELAEAVAHMAVEALNLGLDFSDAKQAFAEFVEARKQ
jgi:hypothetical protein